MDPQGDASEMIRDLLIATRNSGKLAELRAMLEDTSVSVLCLDDVGADFDVVEDGKTFAENASKKALETARRTRLWAVADDSGLEVDALGGDPGVMSARFAGESATDEENNRKLLRLLQNVPRPDRTARFRCFIALATPDGVRFVVDGACEGHITSEPIGSNGFGYDPVFYSTDLGTTFGKTQTEEKNRVSHRARALRLFRQRFEIEAEQASF